MRKKRALNSSFVRRQSPTIPDALCLCLENRWPAKEMWLAHLHPRKVERFESEKTMFPWERWRQNGKTESWKYEETEGWQMCEQRCGHCHACCQIQRERRLFRRQLVSLRKGKKTDTQQRGERKRSDLHHWIFMISVHTDFSPHFCCGFRGVSTCWPTHTHTHTSVHRYIDDGKEIGAGGGRREKEK